MRTGLMCNTCNAELSDEAAQKSHYRSDWHQYNLRRKVAGVPGITEALFKLRLDALAAEKKKLETGHSLVYKCSLCNREYRSLKAHTQHLTSKQHTQKALAHPDALAEDIMVTRLAPKRPVNSDCDKNVVAKEEDSGDEWEEVNEQDAISGEDPLDDDDDEVEDFGEWDAEQCFVCDLIPDGTIEGCLEHMHKQHGFFIPDSKYLKDPRGLLKYLGLKVTRGLVCLYCDERGKQFQSVEAVRKHMICKSHCKLNYGDEGVDEELEDFYDFSSSYTTDEGFQVVSAEETPSLPVSVTSGGSELVIRQRKECVKLLGSREFARYYKQRPRPSDHRDSALVNALVARYRSMGLSTHQPLDRISNSKEARKLPQVQAEIMRTKLGVKNNVIRNLPKNVLY